MLPQLYFYSSAGLEESATKETAPVRRRFARAGPAAKDTWGFSGRRAGRGARNAAPGAAGWAQATSDFASLDLIAANRIDRETLQADAAPLGVGAALAVGEVFATTLPPGLLTTARWSELVATASTLPELQRSKLQQDYRLRAVPFGNGQLLIAVQQSIVEPFRSTLVRLSVGLALVVLILTLAVVMWQFGRILQPLDQLTRAAELLSRGQLLRSRPLVAAFAQRRDEIGSLARAQLQANTRLHTVVKASQKLARHIESSVDTIDGVAKTVAAGAARQEERLEEVTGTLEPLTRALIHTSQGLHDAHNIVTTLSLSSSAADQTQAILGTAVRRAEALLNSKEKENSEPRTMRTASVLQQSGVMAQAVADQREVFLKIRESVFLLRSCIDAARESQLMEQHHGQHAQRATTEIGHLAKLHAQDAASLRASSELLRQDLIDLQKQLASLDARNSEELSQKPGEARLPVSDRASLEEGRRRSERLRSSPSLSLPGRRSLPGLSSSQSLSPVPGPAPVAERRATVPPSAYSGGGLHPHSRSSGSFPKVNGPPENSPSGTSLRTGYASSISGSGLVPSKGPGPASGASLGGSSGTNRPVPGGSQRSMGPASGVSLDGASGNNRPVPGGSQRSWGPASGASLGGSSGNNRPVPAAPHGGAVRPPPAGESGASARSVRTTSDGILTASAQSLSNVLAARRK